MVRSRTLVPFAVMGFASACTLLLPVDDLAGGETVGDAGPREGRAPETDGGNADGATPDDAGELLSRPCAALDAAALRFCDDFDGLQSIGARWDAGLAADRGGRLDRTDAAVTAPFALSARAVAPVSDAGGPSIARLDTRLDALTRRVRFDYDLQVLARPSEGFVRVNRFGVGDLFFTLRVEADGGLVVIPSIRSTAFARDVVLPEVLDLARWRHFSFLLEFAGEPLLTVWIDGKLVLSADPVRFSTPVLPSTRGELQAGIFFMGAGEPGPWELAVDNMTVWALGD